MQAHNELKRSVDAAQDRLKAKKSNTLQITMTSWPAPCAFTVVDNRTEPKTGPATNGESVKVVPKKHPELGNSE